MQEYIAFISYRHKPLDTAVVTRLHRMIEHYRVPREYRRGGKKNMGRVFRDRDELPISSDLDAELQRALDHSEFLIVACTPDTPSSPWVDQEIEYFLRRHDRDNLLAVLISGTPEQSFPPRLTEVYGEDGVTVIDRVEPLAANISNAANEQTLLSRILPEKISVLRRLKSEYLHLAAALLHCPYDSLRQRHKLYRLQRLLAASAAALAVLAVFATVLTGKNRQIENQNQQIVAQMELTQSNESYALSLASAQKLQQGDRVGALQSALEALPTEENDRPYRTEAEAALNDALYTYQGESLRAACRMEQEAGIEQLAFSADGGVLVTLDEYSYLRGYDALDGTLLWKKADTVLATQLMTALPQQDTLLCASNNAVLTDLATGETIASYSLLPGEDSYRYVREAALSPDGSRLAVLLQNEEKTALRLMQREVENGDLLTDLTIPCIPENDYVSLKLFYSQDGSRWAVLVDDYRQDTSGYWLFLGDAETGGLLREWTFTMDGLSGITCAFTPQNDLMTLRWQGDERVWVERYNEKQEGPLYSAVTGGDWQSGDALLVMEDTYPLWWAQGCRLRAFSAGNGSPDAECVLPAACTALHQAGKDTTWLVRQDGVIHLLDDPFLELDEIPTVLGDFGFDTELVAFADCGDPVLCAVSAAQPNCAVVLRTMADETAEPLLLPGLDWQESSRCYTLPDGRLLAIPDDPAPENQAVLYEEGLQNPQTHWIASYISQAKAISQDGDRILFDDGTLLQVSDCWYQPLADTVPDEWKKDRYYASSLVSAGGLSVWIDLTDGGLVWWKDLQEPQRAEYPEDLRVVRSSVAPLAAPGGNGCIVMRLSHGVSKQPEVFGIYDTAAGEWRVFDEPEGAAAAPLCTAEIQPWFAAMGGDGICRILSTGTGEVLQAFPVDIGTENVAELRFAVGDRLLFLRQPNGILHLYDTASGEKLARYQTEGGVWENETLFGSERSELMLQTDEAANSLYVADSAGWMTGLVLDLDTLQCKAEVPGLCGFLPESRQLVCLRGDTCLLYPANTLKDTTDRAAALLDHIQK